MATFNHISGAEPSTVTFKLATVTQTRNSSVMHQEIMALGDPDSSLAIAAVSSAAPAAGHYGLVVRQVGYVAPSTTVIISGDSTVAPLAGSTWATRPIQSSAADLQVTATIGTNLQSSVLPSSGSSGLVVRQVIDGITTVSSTDAFGVGTTSFSIQTSGASLRSYVTAYSILTTNAGPTKVAFYTSNTMLWPMVFAAVSSAVTGANLATPAPAYIFRTNASEALTLRTKNSSVSGWQVAVSYFRAQ